MAGGMLSSAGCKPTAVKPVGARKDQLRTCWKDAFTRISNAAPASPVVRARLALLIMLPAKRTGAVTAAACSKVRCEVIDGPALPYPNTKCLLPPSVSILFAPQCDRHLFSLMTGAGSTPLRVCLRVVHSMSGVLALSASCCLRSYDLQRVWALAMSYRNLQKSQ